jgi:hypothetical protein
MIYKLHVFVTCRRDLNTIDIQLRVRFEPVIIAGERPQNYVFNRAASRLQQLMAEGNKGVEYLTNISTMVRSAIGSGADSWRLRVRGVIGIILPGALWPWSKSNL